MSSIINSNTFSYGNRSSSHATKSSARGVNLLGWEKEEIISMQDQREILIERNRYLCSLRKTVDKTEWEENLKLEYHKNCLRIKELKEITGKAGFYRKAKTREFSHHLLDIVKERVTKAQWSAYVKEADRRMKDYAES